MSFDFYQHEDSIRRIFTKILDRANMQLKVLDKGEAEISSDRCIIRILMERYYDDLLVLFIDPNDSKKEFTAYWRILEAKGIELKSLKLPPEDPLLSRTEREIQAIAFHIQEHLMDVLLGDFSFRNQLQGPSY
jgi:hypothetical protein